MDERIEWLAVDKKDGMVLLVTAQVLYGEAYNQKYTEVTWEDSYIRALLNEQFYEEAFTAKEQELIVTTQIVTKDNHLYGTEGGKDTYDKVFLLSAEEAEKYFADNEARKVSPTVMALRHGINTNSNERSSWWWLRDKGENSLKVAVVTVKGEVDLKGEDIQRNSGAIRPAIWVKCE